ncbi:immune inhibitor A [Alkalihalobacillus macyae]|uniref:immune inhibitor A domain-containing protein n=1 Tax=Guptibacillus hwajinpoensis TaxID=208199 RepID=UPI00273A9CA8|nr:immune inhibitor A domain-containing protein [Alkalihalobacillus macyae]MDP4552860.1 immune inhibitor A [Alkalihalobacillus macyae]
MKGKNVLSMAMIAALTLGSLAPSTSSTVHAEPSTSVKQEVKKEHVHKQGPFDLAVANEEKLIEMLKESGEISKNDSATEAEKELNQFLEKKSNALKDMESAGELNDEKLELEKEIKDKLKNDNDKKAKDNGRKGGKKLDTVVEEDYHGDVRSDNVLVLLVEFPDFPHNSIQPDESDMYYEDYVKEHYQDMIFGEDGYEGPNGENLVSMKQFYEEQTDGAYTVNGNVAGWYMASKNAAEYGGNNPNGGSDKDARSLVKEALTAAAADPSVNLAEYDQEDRYDLDGDGNFREADGLIDHLMVVHSAVGEEAGGGQLGEDAIWSHRWNLGGVFPIAGSPEPEVDYWEQGSMYAYDYTIEPADGAAGVFAHEYGHDLGLPDEYDTQYSGAGEAVSYWSLMAGGSWAGKLPGTEPTGFSAWSKEFLQAAHGGNWLKYDEVDLEDIDKKGLEVYLDQANTKGTNLDALRINLPDKETQINTPFSGEFDYFSGSADDLNNSAVFNVNLSDASNGELSFKTWYDIETDWDYGSVQVSEDGENWTAIPGNITTDTDPYETNPGNGITGNSDGWIDGTFDLSDFAGKEVFVKFNYLTDGAVSNPGFYIDDIRVTADGNELFFDDAEGTPKVDLQGFTKDDGVKVSEHYYLLEWRNHQGVDKGLGNIRRGASMMSFEPGLVVWYADNKYSENWTGIHPGEGFLGVVDADQHELFWSDGTPAQTRYQIHDAAFSLRKDSKMFIDYSSINGLTMTDKKNQFVKKFDDSKSYLNEAIPDAGRNVTEYGLNFKVTGEATDRSVGRVSITRK